ncbi:MAG: hypothetical protein ACLFUC_05030 [Bacteroidales bacterium]
MNLKLLFVLLIIFLQTELSAQYYTRSIGLRGGETSGFMYRHMNNELSATGILLSFKKDGVQLTLLREFFNEGRFTISELLYISTGYGAHVGFSHDDDFRFFYHSFKSDKKIFSPVVGIDGYIALEYRMHEIPIIIGFDYKPYFEFSTHRFFKINIWDTAFSLRYRF